MEGEGRGVGANNKFVELANLRFWVTDGIGIGCGLTE